MAIKLNARSPYYLTFTDESLDSVTVSLFIYKGEFGTDKPPTPQFRLNKTILGETGGTILVEIGELIRDYLDINFNQEFTEDLYEQRVINDYGTFEGSSCLSAILNTLDDDYRSEVVWVEADCSLLSPAAGIRTEYFDFIAFDGYSYFTDGANAELSRTLLQSNKTIYSKSGEVIRVPVFTEEVTSVQFYNNGVLQATQNITPSTNSSGQIKYASTTLDVDEIRVISSSGTETIKSYQTEECGLTPTYQSPRSGVYTPQKVTFINKFGVFQDMWFFTKSVESIQTKSKEYKSNVINQLTGEYDIQTHQYRQFHKQGRESITMNTGYISEEYNDVIKQIMLSEQVWMTKTINSEKIVIPITPKTESLTYKTRVNDKLINYSIAFDSAFDEINNIR